MPIQSPDDLEAFVKVEGFVRRHDRDVFYEGLRDDFGGRRDRPASPDKLQSSYRTLESATHVRLLADSTRCTRSYQSATVVIKHVSSWRGGLASTFRHERFGGQPIEFNSPGRGDPGPGPSIDLLSQECRHGRIDHYRLVTRIELLLISACPTSRAAARWFRLRSAPVRASTPTTSRDAVASGT